MSRGESRMSSARAAQITSSFFLDYASPASFFRPNWKHLIECMDKRQTVFVLGALAGLFE